MGFEKVYSTLLFFYPQLDTRALTAAIEHSKEVDSVLSSNGIGYFLRFSQACSDLDVGLANPFNDEFSLSFQREAMITAWLLLPRAYDDSKKRMSSGDKSPESSIKVDAPLHISGKDFQRRNESCSGHKLLQKLLKWTRVSDSGAKQE